MLILPLPGVFRRGRGREGADVADQLLEFLLGKGRSKGGHHAAAGLDGVADLGIRMLLLPGWVVKPDILGLQNGHVSLSLKPMA